MTPELKQRLTGLVYEVLDELNAERAADAQIAKAEDTRLFGAGGKLDSMDLVRLVVSFEQRVTALGTPVSIADERAMSMRNSPFASVSALVDYTAGLLAEASNG